jgi:hypothetical protein
MNKRRIGRFIRKFIYRFYSNERLAERIGECAEFARKDLELKSLEKFTDEFISLSTVLVNRYEKEDRKEIIDMMYVSAYIAKQQERDK